MKIRDSIIMLCDIFPYCHGMIVLAVKGTVHEFHLRNFIVDKKLQLFFHQLNIAKTELLIYRRKTVAAGKRTTSAALIINDPVLKLCKIFICKRYFA